MTIAEYLQQYDSSWRRLHENDPGLESYNRTLYTAWNLSYEQVKQRSEPSAKLLKLWAYFSNQDLWYELLSSRSQRIAQLDRLKPMSWVLDLTGDRNSFTAAMRLLCNYGLVEGDTSQKLTIESAGYSVHSCVHSWIIGYLNRDWDVTYARFALDAVAMHVPSDSDAKPWATKRRLLQHADWCVRSIDMLSKPDSARHCAGSAVCMVTRASKRRRRRCTNAH